MSFKNTFDKYQKNKNLSTLANANKAPQYKNYNYFIIIPSFNEHLYIEYTLDSINHQNSTLLKELLVVVIVNNSKDDKEDIKTNNLLTYNKITHNQYKYELIVLDAFSISYSLEPKNAGVGMARKIGMDYCIDLSMNDSLFCSIDADTLLSKQYLTCIKKEYQKKNIFSCSGRFQTPTV